MQIGAKEIAVLQKYNFLENTENFQIYIVQGCALCNGTGYIGRTVVSEILPVTKQLGQMIVEKLPMSVISKFAAEAGMVSLGRQALGKFIQGTTSFEEVVKILHE